MQTSCVFIASLGTHQTLVDKKHSENLLLDRLGIWEYVSSSCFIPSVVPGEIQLTQSLK